MSPTWDDIHQLRERPLTRREREVLTLMRDQANSDDGEGELVRSVPGGWWLGYEQVGGKTALSLLRRVFISRDGYDTDTMERYHINSDGLAALERESKWTKRN